MKTLFTSLTLFALSLPVLAQVSGNSVYEANAAVYGNYNNYNNSYNTPRNNNYYLPNDSVYILNTKVMINLLPDAYMAVYCVQQEALNVAECSKLINARIDKFKSALNGLGINSESIFVDMIAQTRIYDFKINEHTATESSEGFEYKKNIIIKFTDHNLLEKINVMAAEQNIFDLVKVDYVINDMEKVQDQLRTAAMQVIENKKKFALSAFALELKDKGLLLAENFNLVFPQESYHQYVAAESSSVQPSYYNDRRWIKEQRKSKTFYFEKLNPALFDKVINPAMVQVPVQATIDLSVKYYIGKPERRTRK